MKNPTLRMAIRFADRGIRCFALAPNSKIPMAGSSGVHDATDDREKLEETFSTTPNANLAAVPGPERVVVDIDVKNGTNGFDAWRELLPDPPDTLIAKTPSGGQHSWFQSPIPLKNTTSLLANGIDTRAVNGYVVLPPSTVQEGQYQWISSPNAPIADIPTRLLNLLVASQQKATLERSGNEFVPEGVRNDWLFTLGCSLRGRGLTNRQIFSELLAVNTTECRPTLSKSEVRRIVKSVSRYPLVESLTETGNARRFATRFRDSAIHVQEQKEWYVPSNGIWSPDKQGVCIRRMQAIASDLKQDSNSTESKSARLITSWANKSLSKNVIKNSLELARSEPSMSAPISSFDQHPMHLALINGVLNLESSLLEQHDLAQRHTKRANVSFDENAKCPRFNRFIDTIFCSDSELIGYIQRHCGYLLTGLTGEQIFTIFYGSGKNGKSTLLLILRSILGDYARHVQPEIISDAKRSPNGASPSLARLCGARLVTTTETEGNHRLGESLIKQVTGSDPVEARHLYKEPFEFIPAFKLILATNHKPIISGNDFAIWRRIHLIPFTVQIPDDECIPNYHEVLLEEADGILNWALEGCAGWQIFGLAPPDVVVKATDEYRVEQDIVTQFLHDTRFQFGELPRPDVHKLFVNWAESNGEEVISNVRLYEQLAQYGCKVKTVRGTKIITGLPTGSNETDDYDWDI